MGGEVGWLSEVLRREADRSRSCVVLGNLLLFLYLSVRIFAFS
jgi:hypothetical protein